MIVFAIGGTTFGMTEESLAFYVLIITVMVAAGYDALVGASLLLLGCGIGVLGSTINPFATGIASGFAGHDHRRGAYRPARSSSSMGTAFGIWFVMRYAVEVKADPSEFTGLRAEGRQRGSHSRSPARPEARGRPEQPPEAGPRSCSSWPSQVMIYGVIPWADLGHPPPDPLVVVPGDDRLVPAVRDPHRRSRRGCRRGI